MACWVISVSILNRHHRAEIDTLISITDREQDINSALSDTLEFQRGIIKRVYLESPDGREIVLRYHPTFPVVLQCEDEAK